MPSNKPISNLKEKFNGIIWKIEVDEENDIIAIESRDAASHTAFFSALNYSSGECYFKEQTTENSWWWGLDRVHRGVLFLHGYKVEGSPEHRGIIAWNAKTGETQWQQFNYALDAVATDGLVAHNPLIQLAKPEILSPETGKVIRRNVENYELIERQIVFPSLHPASLPLPDFVPQTATGPVFTYSIREKSCWSFHVKTQSGFTQKLVITEKNEPLVTENLAIDIQKLNPEAFFIHKNNLFCIRHHNHEIVSFLL